MATAPPEYLCSSGRTEVFTWQPNTVAMHVTRPKSAKGRTRASLSFSHDVEAYSFRVPTPPPPDVSFETPRSQRGPASATSRARSGVRTSQEEIPEILQQMPSRPSSSLNKYMVLPSIRRQGTGDISDLNAFEQTSKLHLNDRLQEPQKKPLYRSEGSAKGKAQAKGSRDAVAKPPTAGSETPPVTADMQRSLLQLVQKDPLEEPALAKPPTAGSETSPVTADVGKPPLQLDLDEPLEEPRLLLAVKSPSGQRYERYFRPTDSLQTIIAVAEQRAITQYKNCSIETMEVPRRSFSDLSKSLEDCGIPNKSVLCIFQTQQE